mmetsp:Transcript_36364/g.102729  ORF Transcript_36364/g.102729 Transcript_36364/m.102729 type:complete len:237 (-) Transcript_36364:201-911(-)|eukprot:CAMPEP_0117681120 /NCGR_PEP_ID=MMETSP0804-20121206/18778_1 /TAXON_ID=1074897 /ORGANISM="Tetraselmis astigmatica, Strain CCMP880" /LENGTH=236 /DNA_ID=CAMNT_0005490787 /DNA_START=85 /DNA_END=795 /DNA_ORIENTATION=+
MSSTPPPTSGPPAEELPQAQLPCFFKGVEAALSGAVLGYVFGWGSKMVMYRDGGGFRARLGAAAADGGSTAKTFGVFGGIYTAMQCYVGRIRQKQDPFNNAIAGCSTGLLVAYQGGPFVAAQSCIGIGIISYYIEKLGFGVPPDAVAASMAHSNTRAEQVDPWALPATRLLLLPLATIFRPCSASPYGGCDVSLFQPGRAAPPRLPPPRRQLWRARPAGGHDKALAAAAPRAGRGQ